MCVIDYSVSTTYDENMRTQIVHRGAGELSYDIRGIVALAKKIQAQGMTIIWENIGDPIAKGHAVPTWIKDIIRQILDDDVSFGYSPTRGVGVARRFIATQRSREGGATLSSQDILFFNGLGDAISIVYTYLNDGARILGPSPAYPTHSSAEGAHARQHHLTYMLDPAHGWLPNIEDIRNKVRYNPTITGILIINPDNPTGVVYPEAMMRDIVAIAREYDLFIISDEIYAHLAYGDEPFVSLAQVIGDVPGIALRGLSKEVPWPGARCGWAEFYNRDKDADFARYTQTLYDAKMLEVCATTLPQYALPQICGDARFAQHLAQQRAFYKRRAIQATAIFRAVPGVTVVQPQGAFYITVVFDDMPVDGTLVIDHSVVRTLVENAIIDARADARFVYYLLGATGICTVPLSSFNSDMHGFRMTLLERDDVRFTQTCTMIADALVRYRNNKDIS